MHRTQDQRVDRLIVEPQSTAHTPFKPRLGAGSGLKTVLGLGVAVFGGSASAKKLLDLGAKVDKATRFGSTPLLYAAKTGNREVARLLLQWGAFADTMSNDGETPLHAAAWLGDQELVSLLLDAGHASINGGAGNQGETALHAAASRGHANLVRWLVEHHADVTMSDSSGYTALLDAAEEGHAEIVEILQHARPSQGK